MLVNGHDAASQGALKTFFVENPTPLPKGECVVFRQQRSFCTMKAHCASVRLQRRKAGPADRRSGQRGVMHRGAWYALQVYTGKMGGFGGGRLSLEALVYGWRTKSGGNSAEGSE
jgi:hypothetical protein